MARASSLRSFLVLGLAFGGLAGCNLLIGLEEATLADSTVGNGANGNDGSDSSDGGSTGGNGTGGGTSASPDAVQSSNNCADAPLELDQELIRGCVYRISCDPLVPAYNISQCVSTAQQSAYASETCTKNAQSCDDIRDCLGRGYQTASICEGSTSEWACDGDAAVRCGASSVYGVDCNEMGATCVGYQESASFPHVWGCTPNTVPSCTDVVDGEFHCNGSDLYTCLGGLPYGHSCSALSGTCVEPTPGAAYCNSQPSCTNLDEIACDDDIVTYCSEAGFLGTYDCGATGMECVVETERGGFCLPSGCTIDDSVACEESCLDDGVTLRFCQGAENVDINCEALGMGGCVMGSSDSLGSYAFCAQPSPGSSGGDDSCEYANDGYCDEPPLCDAGTDVTDCTLFPPAE